MVMTERFTHLNTDLLKSYWRFDYSNTHFIYREEMNLGYDGKIHWFITVSFIMKK